MLNLLRFVALRHMRAKPARTVLTALGITLGVALFTGVETINRSTLTSFKDNVESVAGKATLTVNAGESGFSEATLDTVEAIEGVSQAIPMIETRAFFTSPDGQIESLMIMGVDLLREKAIRAYKTPGVPGAEQVIDDPLSFLNQPDSIILTRSFSEKHELIKGGKFSLGTAYGPKNVTVRGLLTPDGPAKAYGGNMAVMDIDAARMTFGKEGKLDRLDLITKPGANVHEVRDRIRAQLGAAFDVQEPELQTEDLRRMVGAFQGMLTFLSSLALVVGVFLVSNSMSTAVAERRREIGTLRALGATRKAILSAFLAEAFILGLTGAAAGALLGRVLAQLMVKFVARSMSGQFMTQIQVDHLEFGVRDIAVALAIGLGATIVASLWPALRSSKILPVEALRPQGTSDSDLAMPTRLQIFSPWIGLALLVYLWVAAMTGLGQRAPWLEGLHPLVGMAGAVLIAPSVVSKLIAWIEARLGSGSPIILRLSLGNLLRNPRRTGSNVLSLILGLVLVIIISAVNMSFRETSSNWAAQALSFADVVISANGRIIDFQVQPLHEAVARQFENVPGIKKSDGLGVRALRFIRLPYEGQQVGLKAFDAPGIEDGFGFILSVRDQADVEGRALFGPDRVVLISDSFKTHFKKDIGDTIELITPSGPAQFKIAGVVRDYANPAGVIYINRTRYRALWKDPLVTGFYVKALDRTRIPALRDAIDATIGGATGGGSPNSSAEGAENKGLLTTLASDLVGQLAGVIDQSFAFNRAIEAAALLVGLIGLLNTLLISVIERTRELGMLRAIGMGRKQLFSMILIESLIQGGLGAFTAVVFGGYLSYLWVSSTLSLLLGWLIRFHFPWLGALGLIFTGIVVALAAGYYPARRAAKIQVREAIVYE